MKIVVLAGGLSTERDVSLTSGSLVCTALRKKGHDAILADVYLGMPDLDFSKDVFAEYGRGEVEKPVISDGVPDLDKIRSLRADSDVFMGPNVMELCRMADIAFLALHGENGENGKLQATLDLFGIKYTGTGSLGSALAMHKGIAKQIFKEAGIPTPEGCYVRKGQVVPADLPFPCVVKPCSGGSSIGVSIVNSEAELDKALADAFLYEDELVIEKFIKGREFSIGVLEGEALPIIEIIPNEGFYDYVNKYQAGKVLEVCPAELDEEIAVEMQKQAVNVFYALKLEAYGRIDFLLDEDNKMYCLEANTLPGMTPMSLLPQEAAQIGLSYEDLCEKIIEISLKK